MPSPLAIHVVSDIVCPWCYIGKRRLEKAIAMTPEIPVEVRYHPYFLNPWVPLEGISREDYLTRKFGSVAKYKSIANRVAEAAASEGLTYAIDLNTRQPNTTDAHRLILWAGDGGDQSRMKQRLMDLYFAEGADLTDLDVLVQAAVDGGLEGDMARTLLDSNADVERVTQAAKDAMEAGISGVPTFIFGGRLAVSGAQEPAHLAAAIRQAVADLAQPAGNAS